ncbi:DUF4099 domain-containing protein [Mucilaginibacter sp. HC2]|uniref:DUF4099 domain-containing protein n=1 Tax=Mucilaginibacter TaxID=423349 RepID=UPI000DCBEA54|nr:MULTISPECIES: DUF4099 domain-containing protein [Mucilaginibacter]NHA05479.1 DUF4099 domain-containing protein [Mucilaginibacter inviolabilis]QTE35287.1 DUF4099 domain-containing protein [Mucilaginibacter gossypii]RAV59507.1 hypothetical protein DIU36_06680 [Mucilaginibacter rubeus]
MNLVNFQEDELPIKDLETIGLAAGGQLLLNVDDLKALLSGRRTGLMELHDLEAENIRIKSINAKISLKPNEAGKLDLLIHPVYRKAATPEFLDETEAQQLRKGEVASLLKITVDDRGNKKEMLVEYDPETREYIVSDTDKILAPDMVNNEFLTPAQKENYRKGREVRIADGTKFSYSATDHHGIRSNKLRLVASILIDGGLSYMVYKGLNALFNQKRDQKTAEKLSPGYHQALKDIENQHGFVPHQFERTRAGRSR